VLTAEATPTTASVAVLAVLAAATAPPVAVVAATAREAALRAQVQAVMSQLVNISSKLKFKA